MKIKTIILILFSATLSLTTYAGPNGLARRQLNKHNYNKVLSILNDQPVKDATSWYYIGEAHYQLDNIKEAHVAWQECLKSNNTLPSKNKWRFLSHYQRKKQLSPSEKKKLRTAFLKKFQSLNTRIHKKR